MSDDLNPFDSGTYDPDRQFRQDLLRWRRMQTQLPKSDFLSKVSLTEQQKGFSETMGAQVEQSWQKQASTSGKLYPERFTDAAGRICTKFHGDIRAWLDPFLQKPIRGRLAKLVHFENRAYIEGHVPPKVRAKMALAKLGLSPSEL